MDPVPPVTRGEFLFRDVLLVDVGGELKRHSRATEHEIKALLTGKSPKDQVGHWWEAQLIHYGLQRSKQKDTAKVRLQQALAQGKLKAAPPHLLDMEAQMKKEYQSAVRKAMKPHADAGKGAKRAREDETNSSSKRTKITVRVGDVEIDVDHSGPGAFKKQKTVQTPASKESKKSTMAVPASAASVKAAGPGLKPKGTKKQAEAPPLSPDNVFQRSASKPKSAPTSKVKASTFAKTESKIKSEPRATVSAPSRSGPSLGYLFDADAMDTRPDLTQDKLCVTGVYTIICPQITEQLGEESDALRLFMCVDNETGNTWGAFQLAWKSGVIKLDEIDFNRKLIFSWRAKDSWTSDLKFGQKCFGDVEFDGVGGVTGVFYNLFNEACEFAGHRRTGPQWSGRSAYSYKQEWDSFPRQAYGR